MYLTRDLLSRVFLKLNFFKGELSFLRNEGHSQMSVTAEIIPSVGLGGLLLGQPFRGLKVDERWLEGAGIVRANLFGGAIQVVVDSRLDRVIGLLASEGYRGKLGCGIAVGDSLASAREKVPALKQNEFDDSWYEPRQLGFVLHLDDDGQKVAEIWVVDWAHDYWAYARPLVHEDDLEE